MICKDDTVRLTRELAEFQLPAQAEGTVDRIVCGEDGQAEGAEVRFHTQSGTKTLIVPLDALEPVLSRAHHRTAVFWGSIMQPGEMIESAMHVMLDHGFELQSGLNLVRLQYDSKERWWKWGERFKDPTGATVVTSAASWDGTVVAFSGRQRFQLQFRLAARRGPVLMVHETEEAYAEQASKTAAAMTLARCLYNLYDAIQAEFCAFPVADAWLADEDWPSLWHKPHYPDFFLTGEPGIPEGLDSSFRVAKLKHYRAMVTVLPVKFSPSDPPLRRSERELKMDALRKCKSLGEKYYNQMYEAHGSVNGLYADTKDAFYDAISIANELGLKDEGKALEERLGHIKAVFRSQFS